MIVKLVLTLTILSVDVTRGEDNNLTSILESKSSFFHKINANIHNAVNNIFNYLSLLKYFSKSDQNGLLLKIHNDFLNIAERNYAVYDHLRNVSNNNYSIGDYRSKFLESLNEIMKEEFTKHKHVRNKTQINAQNNTEMEKSDESLEFLDDFVDKFSKMTIKNLTNYQTNETTTNGVVKLLIKSNNYELKAWNSTFLNGTPSNLTRRLYQGRKTRIKNYPFLVSIHILNDFVCSGSIISKDLVITAASCLQIAYNNHQNPRSVFIRVGSDYAKSNGQLIPVKKIYFHPQYDPLSLKNNIAILRIKNQLKLSSKNGRIRRIQYIKRIAKQTQGVYVLGWGAKNPRHNLNNLQKLAADYLDLYSFHECQKIYTSHYVTDKNFCAGFIDKGNGACNRDVGGPGIRDGTLVGIISFGPPSCGMPNSPTVFTNIGYYATWIDTIVHQRPAVLKILKPFPTSPRSVLTARTARTARSRSLSKKLLYTTPFTTHLPTKRNDDYPDEVKILKEMLQEIVLANHTMVDYILYGNTVDKQKTTASDIESFNNDNVNIEMVNDDDNKSSDVSENYEDHPGHEQEIAIDTNDFALKNMSFFDVLFNLQQYQKSNFPSKRNKDKNENKLINVQFFLGPELGIDTTPGYLDRKITKIDDVESEIEEHSGSDNDNDEKTFLHEDNKVYYPLYNPWQSAFTNEVEKGSSRSKQYEINLQGRNLPEQMKQLFGIPRANMLNTN